MELVLGQRRQLLALEQQALRLERGKQDHWLGQLVCNQQDRIRLRTCL